MIVKSIARSQFIVPNKLDKNAMIEVNEKCVLCDNEVQTSEPVLRRRENSRLLCLPCILDIAMIEE